MIIKTTKPEDNGKPAYDDDDKMKFGMHVDKLLLNVPSKYLLYLWNEGYSSDVKLVNYIYNNIHSLMQDCPDVIVSPRKGYPIQ